LLAHHDGMERHGDIMLCMCGFGIDVQACSVVVSIAHAPCATNVRGTQVLSCLTVGDVCAALLDFFVLNIHLGNLWPRNSAFVVIINPTAL